MARNRGAFYNASGCPDPTAYYGLQEVIKEEKAMEKQVTNLLHIIRLICNLVGFEIVGRVQFKHKKSGRVFK